jgi:hypothetical protein
MKILAATPEIAFFLCFVLFLKTSYQHHKNILVFSSFCSENPEMLLRSGSHTSQGRETGSVLLQQVSLQ